MSNLLDVALSCIARGWHVFPCWPRTKKPMTKHGWHDASNDEAQVRAWWTNKPDANVAIACGPSNLAVLDVDHGLHTDAKGDGWPPADFMGAAGLPCTYSVRTGRRPEYGLQLYYSGQMPDVGLFKLCDCEGQVKSAGGYVMAAGSIHPDTGVAYLAVNDGELALLPDVMKTLRSHSKHVSTEPGKKIGEGAGRHDALMRIACGMRTRGLDGDTMYAAMLPINPAVCETPISDEDLRAMCDGIERRYAPADEEVSVIIGKPKEPEAPGEPVDWRTHYHSFADMDQAPAASFLIDGFLQQESITALAAPVGQRKSIIALNVAHALCTGEPLFDHFKVVQKPTRVLYLCPEMGIRSFTERVRKIGLMEHVGERLFCRTMSAKGGVLGIDDLSPEELRGSVVIIDTAVRYLLGDENSSEHMRFAASVFRFMGKGEDRWASSVLLLHHSAKGTKETKELTLENAMRGSGELGAFVTSCWATRLQDPSDPNKSASFLSNVKQRDFESLPFEALGGPDFRMHIVAKPGEAVLKSQVSADRDGRETDAMRIIRANTGSTLQQLVLELKENGISRSKSWVSVKRAEVKGTGSIRTS